VVLSINYFSVDRAVIRTRIIGWLYVSFLYLLVGGFSRPVDARYVNFFSSVSKWYLFRIGSNIELRQSTRGPLSPPRNTVRSGRFDRWCESFLPWISTKPLPSLLVRDRRLIRDQLGRRLADQYKTPTRHRSVRRRRAPREESLSTLAWRVGRERQPLQHGARRSQRGASTGL